MDFIESFEKAATYLKNPNHKNTLITLNKWFPGFNNRDIICNIAQNPKVWSRIMYQLSDRPNGENFILLSTALEAATPNCIMVYFADIGIYRVYNCVEDYYAYCDNLRENTWNDPDFKINTHQITLADQNHKLIFITNNNSIDTVRKYVKDYFKSDISVIQNGDDYEITVINTSAVESTESKKMYDGLFNHIYAKQPALARQLNQLPFINNCGREIRTSKAREPGEMETFEDCLIAIGTNNKIKTVNIIINNGGIINNTGIINNICEDNKETKTVKWIQNNLPKHKEFTTTYYDRYCKDNNNPLCVNKFSSYVKAQGYTVHRGNSTRYWVKAD
jgi:hypothetical protein